MDSFFVHYFTLSDKTLLCVEPNQPQGDCTMKTTCWWSMHFTTKQSWILSLFTPSPFLTRPYPVSNQISPRVIVPWKQHVCGWCILQPKDGWLVCLCTSAAANQINLRVTWDQHLRGWCVVVLGVSLKYIHSFVIPIHLSSFFLSASALHLSHSSSSLILVLFHPLHPHDFISKSIHLFLCVFSRFLLFAWRYLFFVSCSVRPLFWI